MAIDSGKPLTDDELRRNFEHWRATPSAFRRPYHPWQREYSTRVSVLDEIVLTDEEIAEILRAQGTLTRV